MNAIRRLSLAVVLATFALLLVGATVSATGAGLACPDWPLCHGRLVPPLERLVLIEYGHRLLASAVGLMTLALAALVWRGGRWRDLGGRMIGLLVLLAIQAGLGGATVLSGLAPVIVGVHLTAAMTFLALLAAFTAKVHWGEGGADLQAAASHAAESNATGESRLRGLVHAALGVTFLQITLGGFTSAFGAGLACPDLPLCRGSLLPAGPGAAVLHATHRLAALAVAGVVFTIAGRTRRNPDAAVRAAGFAAAVLVVVQLILGVLNVLTRLDAVVRVAHLGGAAALLAALVVLMGRTKMGQEAPWPPAPRTPSTATGTATSTRSCTARAGGPCRPAAWRRIGRSRSASSSRASRCSCWDSP